MSHAGALLAVAVLGLIGCTKYERMDPTGATKQILYEKPPTGGTTPPIVPPVAPSTLQPSISSQATAASGLDSVELVSGERLQGKVREVGPTNVIVELAGQRISIERAKIRTIQFATD
jgi:hypothetical protein